MSLMKNTFALGLGAAITAKEQIQKTSEYLVKKGETSAAESQALVKELIEKGGQAQKSIDEMVRKRVESSLEHLNLASKEEVDRLERRIEALEQKNL
ncbi:phasin family protein [Bacillus massiliglaciei]|uniref:phasin family protein n=1 Tax=Bacillus massiliglaciei TaxID=1816693 RepID=UPI001F383AB4|nr:phasin family protein [Bacillus massiliglaciei]